MTRVRSILALLVLAGLSVVGCESTRTVAPPEQAPEATSAVGALKRLEWAFNHRDVDAIAGLLTADVEFVTASVDSAGSPVRGGEGWTRETLLASIRALLLGDPQGKPAATRVELVFDKNPVSYPDPRAGRTSDVHRYIRTSISFEADEADGTRLAVTGHLLFFLTRGDSAQVPADQLRSEGTADPSRWWIDRFEDETIPASGYRANPSHRITFGEILRLYRDPLRQ